MAWVISRDDQGGIFFFSCSISLIVLTIQIIRSFAFIFPLMIIWRNNLFSAQHCACTFPHTVRPAPVCDGPVGSAAGNSEVLLSPEDQTVEATGQPSVFGTTCSGIDWCSSSGEWEATILSVLVIVLPLGLQGRSSPLCLCCSRAVRPLSKAFHSAVSWCRGDVPTHW